MTTPVEPEEADVLRAIGELLARPRSAAALAHYPTLRIQTTNLRRALKDAIEAGEQVAADWLNRLGQDASVAPEFRAIDATLHPYRTIAPALVRNLNRTAEFFLEEARPAPKVDVDQVGETVPSFSDFVRLGAAARVFLDALVQTAFQLVAFDGRQLNYKFLHSLQGFAPVAPPSLHSNIYSDEIQAALSRFASMSPAEIKSSNFVTRSHEQFGQRLKTAIMLGYRTLGGAISNFSIRFALTLCIPAMYRPSRLAKLSLASSWAGQATLSLHIQRILLN